MTTLLDLKSSVLRQVQRSQSLRSRREPPPPTASSPLTHCPDPIPRRISEESVEFFERMNAILQKQENMMRAAQAECQRGACTVPPPQEHVDQAFIPDRISRTELDLLYEEAVYTVVNRVGVPSPEHVKSDDELFAYLLKVFDMGEEEHEIILQKVQESKRANFSLRVSVMKAKNLMAKDANGYSDPYCMLGILVGQSPRETEEKKERKFSFRKRKDKLEKRSSTKEVLPARCIQVTEVKPETLNPVWDEHFVFEIDDVHNDLLHLDIWDHDDDVSVAEACKKLNEVSGLRGMGRYFKQIAKSVRANGSASSGSEENVDDFLGCINIPLNEIPVMGYDTWFKLEPRSSASKVQGECHLILKLFTSQRDTALSKKETNVSIHKKLLSQIVEYEHAHVKREPYNWNGQVSPPAWTVLTHHAVQTDLSPLQQAIIRWQCYSSHHRTQRVCYSLLLRLLRTIDAEWDPPAVRGDLERQLSDSFRLYTEHCLCLMKNMRQVFPCTSAAAITRYELMLRGIGYMQNMRAFKTVCPLRNDLHLDITTAIKKGTAEWYESLIARYKPEEGTLEEQLKKLVQVIDAVCADVQRAQNIYNKLFYSAVKVDFFSISYRLLEKQVADDVNVAMERVCGTLEQESSRLTQTMGETIFELFMSLKILKGFREFLPLKDAKMLALTGFHNWFKSSIHKWLQIVHDRSCDRIRKAVETDKLGPLQQAKHSSSAVEVTACFSQVREIWVQLAWPDSAGAFIFVTRLTDNFCSEAVCYSEMITHKIERNQLGRDHKSFTVQLCIALNNIEHVRVFLGHLPRDLDWQGVERAMEESCGVEGKEQVYKALNGQLFNMDLDLQREAKRLITLLTDKMLPELRRYIQHISLSPDSINNDDAVSPLMKYLQDTMVILTENLVKENLTRVLQSMWELLLRMILDTVTENRGVQVEFYNRFQYTVETLLQFFHARGEGLFLEDMKSGDYKVLDEELRLNKCSSFELIEQYYLEKISHQKTLKHTRYGRISVKCYYDAPEQRLTVEILHAADIIALDANGLSDPFVIVELCPHHLFPMAKSQRTQVKLKTLHPVFDELFYFHVSPEQYRHRFACLTFTVMDYDWLSTNDFAGEAVAPLSDFCWPGRPNASAAGKSVQPVILHLSRSKPSGTYGSGRYHLFCFIFLLLFFFYLLCLLKHNICFLKTRGCKSGFPITSSMQHEKPFNQEIFVSGVETVLICFLSPPEKPIMGMLEARVGDREAQEFVRRLKEIEKSMEEE
ncbi:BAI1-associated protein 3 isoform X1 [Oreochromis aureus]|uniref:BAI1-associated protein 3 isoform X1 n=1 Tax=Oreochromis aureus TaxID=47969 RepID=UPI00195393E7|nr:BAI1-associated protein 3 isoform X1 [Oreochromis aureus]XP_039467395.1 BAI1-associated protein 3 isoform X1 [Oreochromis aureus]